MHEITNEPSQDWFQTRDINLAAALSSFDDVQFYPVMPVQKFKDHEKGGAEFYVFRFKHGERQQKVVELWNAKDHPNGDSEHPAEYMRAFMHNRNRLLDVVKGCPTMHMVKKGNRIHFMEVK